ncbi:MAG: hypothetical protein JXA96_09660 [Sedimentisphaerales bacterium]|nr:hypothetical protein [Sedimentisphaerales bacterium]
MQNTKQIIAVAILILFGFAISRSTIAMQISAEKPTSIWDLVQQDMTKKTEPNIPVKSERTVQPDKPAELALPVEPAKTQQVETQTDERILHFPKDHFIGQLYIQDESFVREIRDFNPVEEWEPFTEAKGDIEVPAGKRLSLNISEANRRNLSALSALSPDDLYRLIISGSHPSELQQRPKPNDSCVPYIARLTGLKDLYLAFSTISTRGFSQLGTLKSLERLTLSNEHSSTIEGLTDEQLAEISKMRSLKGLYIIENRLTDNGLIHLANLTSLKELQIGGGQLTDAGLANLTKLPSLEYLSLYSHNFTDDGLAYLKDIPSLRILDAGASHIWTDEALKHIAKINNLEALDLNWSENITDDGIAVLAELKSLKKLNISKSKVTDIGLSYLKNLKTLDYLTLPPRGISDTGLTYLGQLSNLKHLDVSRVHYVDPKMDVGYYTDKGVAELAKCKLLEELTIGSIGMTDEAMSDIAKLTNLKQLFLFGCSNVTSKGMQKLKTLKSLQNLSIYETNITTGGLSFLNELSNLTNLSLDGVQQDDGVMDISKLTNLEDLTITSKHKRVGSDIVYDKLHNSDIACLAKLTKLKRLQLPGYGLDDNALKYFSNLTNLEFLSIYCAGELSITDEGLKQLTGLPKLYRLIIKDGHFTDKSLEYLSGMPALTWLELTSDFAFSNKAMDNFQKNNPKIDHLVLIP